MTKQQLGRYEIVAELGKGAMGTVYRATDPLLNRTVAIKTINMSADQAEMADYEARFYQEARAVGGLNHPNIVTVYDIGRSGNVAYMAMELLDGRELRTLMQSAVRLPVAQVVDIAIQIADGLAYAHRHDVVHRDIKPANIMILSEDRVKITDFGIAHMRSAEVRTQTGVLLGSPRYMSPEQALGKRAAAGSDIFSLGVIIYEMLTGKAPFAGADINAIMFQIINLAPPPPSAVNPDAPAMMDFIVAKALAKTLQERYADACELADDLRACRGQIKAVSGSPPSVVAPTQTVFSSVDGDAARQVLAQSWQLTRQADAEHTIIDITATLGISKVFDSAQATRQLAVQTGVADEPAGAAGPQEARLAATHVYGTVISGPFSRQIAPSFGKRKLAWSRRDKSIFFAAIGVATVFAVLIISL